MRLGGKNGARKNNLGYGNCEFVTIEKDSLPGADMVDMVGYGQVLNHVHL